MGHRVVKNGTPVGKMGHRVVKRKNIRVWQLHLKAFNNVGAGIFHSQEIVQKFKN